MSAPVDYFAVLGFEPDYELDADLLRKSFFAKQRETHPDRYGHLAGLALDEQIQLAAQINEAYRVLQDPFRRLEHLLVLRRHTQGVTEHQHPLPPDFLMEMMDLNEEVEKLETHPDATHANDLKTNVEQQITAIRAQTAALLGPETSPEALEKAQTGLEKLRYLLRLRESLTKFASPA